MSSPSTNDEFLALVRKSELVPEPKLEAFLSFARAQNAMPSEVALLARAMIECGLLTVFQAKQLLLGRHRGFDIGRFRVLEGLGTGGMSHVFLCQHKTMGHRVAVKLLPKKLAQREPGTIDQLFREARAAAALNHTNVVRAHDIDRQGDHYYMVMDYVEGSNLHDLVKRRGPLPPDEAAACILQAACGLQHVHDAGLVHRDIKPGNLMLDRYGIIRILDLGLAAFHDASGNLECTDSSSNDPHAIMGTADFLAPEQAMTGAVQDIRSDIYSLGVTFYFLLAGKAPFEDLSLAQKLVGHQFKLPPSPPGPEPLLRILGKMMAKKPERRFQVPEEIVKALAPHAAQKLRPPSFEEMPILSKAASGPLTRRGTSRSITTVMGHSSLSLATSDPADADVPLTGLHAGPRPARSLANSNDDTPTPGSAPTTFRHGTGNPLQEKIPPKEAEFPPHSECATAPETADRN